MRKLVVGGGFEAFRQCVPRSSEPEEAMKVRVVLVTQKVRAVVADGRLYRRADLDRLLAEAEAEALSMSRSHHQ